MNKLQLIDNALKTLFQKLSILNLNEIGISEYNQRYMSEYINDYSFYAPLYRQLVHKAIEDSPIPIEESIFVDYGGGCGFLSLLAREIGFKQVIYSDIYDISTTDAQILSEQTGIAVDHFVCGNIDELLDAIRFMHIQPNVICSFAVIEHIYNLEDWFKKLSTLDHTFSATFLTSANPYNPFIRKRLMKMQHRAEFEQSEVVWGMKERDLKIPFFQARKEIIQTILPEIEEIRLNDLALRTRGLDQNDIRKVIINHLDTGIFDYQPNHPTNTCDPFTGNWTERLIDLQELKRYLKSLSLSVKISSGLYSYGRNKNLNIIKSVLNQVIRLNNQIGLRVSATYMLKVSK